MGSERPQSTDFSTSLSPSAKWTLFAGVYAFGCGAVVLLPLGVVADTLLRVVAFPTELAAVLVSAPSAVIGAALWWTVVERREAYAYLSGGAVGLLTALGTVLFWALLVALVYGLLAVWAARVVVVFVLAVVAPAGFAAALPLMYARRRLDAGPSGAHEQ